MLTAIRPSASENNSYLNLDIRFRGTDSSSVSKCMGGSNRINGSVIIVAASDVCIAVVADASWNRSGHIGSSRGKEDD